MENSSKKELRKLVRKVISENTKQSSFMDIASAIGRNVPGFVEILDLHYVIDGIYAEYLHEDGKAFQFLIKEKKPKHIEVENPISASKNLSKQDVNLNEEN